MGIFSSRNAEENQQADQREEIEMEAVKRAIQKRQMEIEQKQAAKKRKKNAKTNNKKGKGKKINHLKKRSSSAKRKMNIQGNVKSGTKFNGNYILNEAEYNHVIESKTRTHLDDDLSMFVMNQISFAMQFFCSYESEVKNVAKELLAKQNEYNRVLNGHAILLPNVLDATVAKWIQFKSVHGSGKKTVQQLHTPVMYVVFDCIDVVHVEVVDDNKSANQSICKVIMQTDFYNNTPRNKDNKELLRTIKKKGYVRLQVVDNRDNGKKDIVVDVKRPKNIDAETNDGNNIANTKTPGNRYGSDSENEYEYLAELNTRQPLSKLKMRNKIDRNQLNAKVLPDSCITPLKKYIQIDTNTSDSDDCDDYNEDSSGNEDDDIDAHKYGAYTNPAFRKIRKQHEVRQAARQHKAELELQKQLLRQTYLNSKEFMRYFHALLRRHFVEHLPITRAELNLGTYRAASIFTKQYEIIPAIYVAGSAQNWPDCAFKFRVRLRRSFVNPFNGQRLQWPTEAMIRRIVRFGFHIIPAGYAPKAMRNPFRNIEWRIIFPNAERYLELHLSRTQIKVFMMLKALAKTFLEPEEENAELMFVIDKFRMHLFWECERNFLAWPEEFLGDVLVRFLKSFMLCLRTKSLPDYFIEERNIFENIPQYSLASLHSRLADIVSNPAMHLMIALRNLQLTNAAHFFPKLNYKKIFLNLECNDLMQLKMLGKNARYYVPDDVDDRLEYMIDPRSNSLIGMEQHKRDSRMLRRETLLVKYELEAQNIDGLISDSDSLDSLDSIDAEFFFGDHVDIDHPANEGVENLRRTNILEILLDHLLKICEQGIRFECQQIVSTTTAQFKKLCTFYNALGCDVGAKQYMITMNGIEKAACTLLENGFFLSSLVPILPTRMSVVDKTILPIENSNINIGEIFESDSLKNKNAKRVGKLKSRIFRDDDDTDSDENPFRHLSQTKKPIYHNEIVASVEIVNELSSKAAKKSISCRPTDIIETDNRCRSNGTQTAANYNRDEIEVGKRRLDYDLEKQKLSSDSEDSVYSANLRKSISYRTNSKKVQVTNHIDRTHTDTMSTNISNQRRLAPRKELKFSSKNVGEIPKQEHLSSNESEKNQSSDSSAAEPCNKTITHGVQVHAVDRSTSGSDSDSDVKNESNINKKKLRTKRNVSSEIDTSENVIRKSKSSRAVCTESDFETTSDEDNNVKKSSTEFVDKCENTEITSTSGLGKLYTVTDMVRNSPIAKSQSVQTIASKTTNLISRIAEEEQRWQIRKRIKQRVIALKGVLKDSSDI